MSQCRVPTRKSLCELTRPYVNSLVQEHLKLANKQFVRGCEVSARSLCQCCLLKNLPAIRQNTD